MRKALTVLFASLLLFLPVKAEEIPPETDGEQETETEPVPQEGGEPQEEEAPSYAVDISGEYAALIDADSGRILFEKNGDVPMDPASLTKIMTAYLACENLSPSQPLTMSDAAFQTYDHSQGVLWIQQGETLSLEDCVYASLLASANDTCAMLAEAAGGSVQGFVERMNAEARELGLEHTSFDNCFGFSSEGNLASAADLAMLTRRAMKNDLFRSAFGASSYTIPATNLSQPRLIAQDCEFLRDGALAYEEAEGGKIGMTRASGYALSASAKRDGTSLIAVVLGEASAEDAYRDTVRIFEYGFERAQTVAVTPADVGVRTVEVHEGRKHIADVTFTIDSSYSILLPKDVDPSSLKAEVVVENEDAADPEKISAEVIFTLDGEEIGRAPMERRIEYMPEPEPVSRTALAWKIFDYICIGTLAVIVLFPLIIGFFNSLQPPR